MAIVKIHAIKSTVSKALNYIMNPQKTDGKLLVDGFGVTPVTASLEFEMTERMAELMGQNKKTIKYASNKAYHVIQSFAKDDSITPEEALAMGQQFAHELLQDKYEYVIATHTDKGYIHNHIIFNATSNLDYKKFNSHKKIPDVMRAISNKLCAEKGLSIIVNGRVRSSKHYVEWQDATKGTTKSWKEQMRKDMEAIIPIAKHFDDVLRLMKDRGYEVKRRGDSISFKAVGQQRFARMDRLGEQYSEENIIKRILQAQEERERKSDMSFPEVFQAKAMAIGYDERADNVWQLASVVSYLQTHDIGSLNDLRQQAMNVMDQMSDINDQIKQIDLQMQRLKELVSMAQIKEELQPAVDGYANATLKKAYAKKHEADLKRYELIIERAKTYGVDLTQVDAEKITTGYGLLDQQRQTLLKDYKAAKQELYQAQKNDEIVRAVLEQKQQHCQKKKVKKID